MTLAIVCPSVFLLKQSLSYEPYDSDLAVMLRVGYNANVGAKGSDSVSDPG